MSKLIINNKIYELTEYVNENELEDSLENLSEKIFGSEKIFIRTKRRIGKTVRSIPDGYLLNFSTSKPSLYFIEVELKVHDVIKHIATQIMTFSISFKQDKKKIYDKLIEYINKKPELKNKCKIYAEKNDFDDIHDLISKTVHESVFQPIVVIDDKTELEENLKDEFPYEVEKLELKKYESNDGEKVFLYDQFAEAMANATSSNISRTKKPIDASKLDTIIVPARKKGFEEVFIGENRWWEIPISKTMQSQLKYIAAYQIKPIQQVTHIAEIKNIEPWKDTSKYVVNFKDPAQKLDQPIDNKFIKGKEIIRVQGPIYAEHSKLIKSKTLKEVWD